MAKQRRIELVDEVVSRVESTDYFCMACGKQTVWARLQTNDSPHTGVYGCVSCHETYYMNPWVEDGLNTKRIARLLLEKKK